MGDDTIGGMIKARVDKYGDRVMMRHKVAGSWKDITWNEFYDNARNIAYALIKMGVQPGDRVAIFSKNSPFWQMADIAILSVGAASVPLYATITAKQAEYIVRDSGSRAIFVGSPDHTKRVLEVKGNLPELMKVITLDNSKSESPDVMTFDEMLEMGAANPNPDELELRLEAVKPLDLASIVYTSGTTGDPKGVMLLHDNFLSNVRAASSLVEVDDTDIILSFLPLSHSLERMGGYYTALYNGVTVAHAESIDTLTNDIADIRPHWMISVPRLYEKIHAGVLTNIASESPVKQKIFNWAVGVGRQVSALQSSHKPIPFFLGLKHSIANKLVFSKIYAKMGGRLRFFLSGGAPLAKEIAEFFHAMGILILEGYGLTETSPVLTVNTPDAFRFGSVGKPIPEVEVKIAGDGEIIARGPNIMKGYWNHPAETAEVLEGGWFHTGDIGEFDSDGFLHITDRKKDLIVTAGGKNVAPQNIENTLKLDLLIEQVAVIGDRRKFISALIVPNFEELEKWAAEQGIDTSDRVKLVMDERVEKLFKERVDAALKDFDRHEAVQKFVILPQEMTEESGLITPTLKIKRKEVAKTFAGEIDKIYSD